jgi:hypothetical protein
LTPDATAAVQPPPIADVAADDAHGRQRRGTQQLLLARVCVYASAYGVSAILARGPGTQEYGTYGVFVSQLLWLEIMVNFGTPAAIVASAAKVRWATRSVGDCHSDDWLTRVYGSPCHEDGYRPMLQPRTEGLRPELD